MSYEIPLIGKRPSALVEITSKWLFVGVHSFVSVQFATRCERLRAESALEHVGVESLVVLEFPTDGEGFLASRTGERTYVGVDSGVSP